MGKYDLIIKNGTLLDGTGKDRYRADLGIIGERIAKICDLGGAEAERIIDAEGKLVSPGFIDAHCHTDLSLLIWPESEAYAFQGVTTGIAGNCGFSPSVVSEDFWLAGWEYKPFYQINKDPYNEIAIVNEFEPMKAALKEVYDYDIDFKNSDEFFAKAEKQGFSVNNYQFVGHNNLRMKVMGADYARTATPEELEEMKEILRQEMKAGCRGITTGLDHPPGAYANKDELIELCKVAKECGGMYATHFRTFTFFQDGDTTFKIYEGVKEALEIGKAAGIRVHVSHMLPTRQIAEDEPLENKLEDARKLKKLIDDAIADGVEASYDALPNNTGGGVYNPRLGFLLRPYIIKAGSVDQLLKDLEDADYIEEVQREIEEGKWLVLNREIFPNMTANTIILGSKVKEYENKSLQQIFDEKGWGFAEGIINVFKADPYTYVKAGFGLNFVDEWITEILDHPWAVPSSDGLTYNMDSNLGLDAPLDKVLEKLPHPNNYCYAIKYITKFGKDRLEDTIKCLTSLPAEIFSVEDRGVLREGGFADIVVFTESDLATNENYLDTRQAPDGINYVVINGKLTVEDKKHTGAKAGRILKR
jgi:N-acyl-D-aspartate/D-glutamate deacylase